LIKNYTSDNSACIMLDDAETPTKMLRIKNYNFETNKPFESDIEWKSFVDKISKMDFMWIPYKSDEDLEKEATNQLANSQRKKRDSLLSKTDWTHTVDSQLSEERKLAWSTYRQSLRDITLHDSFPFLEDNDWPVEP
jgi:hypothetical protein